MGNNLHIELGPLNANLRFEGDADPAQKEMIRGFFDRQREEGVEYEQVRDYINNDERFK